MSLVTAVSTVTVSAATAVTVSAIVAATVEAATSAGSMISTAEAVAPESSIATESALVPTESVACECALVTAESAIVDESSFVATESAIVYETIAAESAIMEVTASEATVRKTAIEGAESPIMVKESAIVAAPECRMRVVPVVPRSHTDEDSIDEIVRSPITVWRAGVRSIRIVAKLANRWRTVGIIRTIHRTIGRRTIVWSNLHSERNLSLGIKRRYCQKRQ